MGRQMQEVFIIPSFNVPYFLLERIERVKDAESALEYFEELTKPLKRSVLVGSTLFSLVVSIVSDASSDIILEIMKVVFRR